jgi:uncharacterized heparinase superfamily protein
MRENRNTGFMNLIGFLNPALTWNPIKHRFVRPMIWRRFTRKKLAPLSDKKFLQKWNFRGSIEDFLWEFQDRVRLRFFFHPRNRKDFFLSLLTSTQTNDEILDEAKDILENKFETLGSGKIFLGETINWQRDFKSGKEWNLSPSETLDLLDLKNHSDVKVPWELSRFHQVWWLGKAYWLTQNEEYALKFKSLVEDWIENNPVGYGVNWTIAMEASIRSWNWMAGYYFFCESKSLSNEFWMKFFKSLFIHGKFIEYHLEAAWHNGNHYLTDVSGLIALGIFFQHADFGKRWLNFGIKSLTAEMVQQVYSDGVDYEKSTSYHRLVLELFYTSTILCLRNNYQFPSWYTERLEHMFDFVQAYTRPDGSIPIIGDADDGRLFRFTLNDNANDHRHTLSVGAILFQRNDFKYIAKEFSQDALWLFGTEGFEKYQALKEPHYSTHSKAFKDGGFYIMQNENVHLFADAGDIGMNGQGGHGHNDTFSFELWMNGEPLIVDSGTYAYTFDIASRQEFRSTKAHNTIVVDGNELAEFAGLWKIKEDKTRPHVIEWKATETEDILEVEHYGYDPVIHRRKFHLKKTTPTLVITDLLEGIGNHNIESFLHFAPSVRVELIDSWRAIAYAQQSSYLITANSGDFSILGTWFSKSYGIREQNQTLRLLIKNQLPCKLEFEISLKEQR